MEESWKRLVAVLRRLSGGNPLCIAYSGGLDSRFLAYFAWKNSLSVELFHIAGPHVAAADTEYALAWAGLRNLPVTVLRTNPLELPEVAAGSRERCYACKKALFTRILAMTRGKVLCDGTNHSDGGQYRPGMRALRELNIESPLLLAGFDKALIHAAGTLAGLEDPEQKARPCLLTRFPYGMTPRKELLARIELGESLVRQCLEEFYTDGEQPDFRLRCLARNEFALHLNRRPDALLTKKIRRALAAGGITAGIVTLKNLSGFFDKKLFKNKG